MGKVTKVPTKEAGGFKDKKGAESESGSEAEFSTPTQASKRLVTEKRGRGRPSGRK